MNGFSQVARPVSYSSNRIVEPEPVADYGKIIRDALGTYQAVNEMENKEAINRLAQDSITNPVAWEELKRRAPQLAAQIQVVNGVDFNRFFDERFKSSLAMKDMNKQERLAYMRNRMAELGKRGSRDTSGSMEIMQRIMDDDPTLDKEFDTYIEQGYQSGKYKRPPQQTERALEKPLEQRLYEWAFSKENENDPAARAYRKKISAPGADTKDVFKNAKDIRSEIADATKDYDKLSAAYGRIRATTKKGEESAAGDMALLFNYMKLLDPNSVVRESEYATAQNAGSIPDRIRAQYNSAINGQKLSPAQRSDFIKQSGNLYRAAKKQNKKTIDSFIKLGKRFGLKREDILVEKGRPNIPDMAPDERYNQILKEKYNGKANPDQAQSILDQMETEGYIF